MNRHTTRKLLAVTMPIGLALGICGRLLADEPGPQTVIVPQPKAANDGKSSDELGQMLKNSGYIAVPFERTNCNYMIVTVSIAERKCRLILDTGAFSSCLDLDRTKDLKLDWIDGGKEKLAGFPDWHPKSCKIEVMDIRGLKARGVTAISYDIGPVNKALVAGDELPVDGILGTDLLRDYSGIIDCRGHRVFLRSRH